MRSPLRAALLSSSPLVLGGLKAALEGRGDFRIVAAQDGSQAAAAGALARAQVGIVDIATDADLDPIAAIGDAGPALVLLWPERDGAIADWLLAGHAVLPRDAPIDAIAAAAHAAAAGLMVTTPALAAEAMRLGPDSERRPLPAAAVPLTPREREVLLHMSLGLGNRQIAQALHISAHTAKFHVAQVIAKLDASSRTHAVAKGLRCGLVEI